MESTEPSMYSRLGSEPFWKLASAFYARVNADTDKAFRSMFPEDLTEAVRNQAEFLIQFFGGPQTYSERKGHPRLRMRHASFHIDQGARDRWMQHMRGALTDTDLPEADRVSMTKYLEDTSQFLINRH